MPGQGDESGWKRDLLALEQRMGELERQVTELEGTGPESATSASEVLWPEPVAGQTPFAAPPEFVLPPPPPLLTEEAGEGRCGPSLEGRLGSQVFSLVGVLAALVGACWALKLAFERGLIGPIGRALIGRAAGLALVRYDVSGLSAGYRVASFLGLGVLLLAVSFACKKNWLGLGVSGTRESTAGRP